MDGDKINKTREKKGREKGIKRRRGEKGKGKKETERKKR